MKPTIGRIVHYVQKKPALGTINPEAWQAFDLGGEYRVTFERCGGFDPNLRA